MREIKYGAFSECTSLKYISLNEGLKSIEDYVFFCTAIEEIFFPSTITKISTEYLIYSTPKLSNITVHRDNKINSNDENHRFLLNKNQTIAYKCVTIPSVLTVPSSVEILWQYFSNGQFLTGINFYPGSKLLIIHNNALRQCKVTTITFPEGLIELGSTIFDQSTSISVINLPSTLKIVSSSTFSNANSITEINVAAGSKNLKTIEGVLYYNNTKVYFIPPNLTTIIFEKETDSIGSTVLQYSGLSYSDVKPGCKKYIAYEGILYSNDSTPFYSLLACPHNLQTAKIHKDCHSVAYRAFHTCQVVSVEFEGDEVSALNDHAFLDCIKLESINKFPSKLNTIGTYVFSKCVSLKNLPQFPPTFITLSMYSFLLSGVESADFGVCNKLTKLSVQTFYGSSIESITLNDALVSIGSECFGYCAKLVSISLGVSLESIGSNAFANCVSLTEIEFRCKNLREIQEGGFSNTGIVRIEVPGTVSSILQRAFNNCTHLREVIFGSS